MQLSDTRRHPLLLPALTLAAGLAATLIGWRHVAVNDQRAFHRQFNSLAATDTEILSRRLDSYHRILLATQGFFSADADPAYSQFSLFAAASHLDRYYPGLRRIGYLPVVRAADRAAFEAHARLKGVAGFQIHPPGPRPLYTPALFLYPPLPNAVGFDSHTLPERAAVMDAARDSGQPRATHGTRLIDDPENRVSIVLYAPVYAPAAPRTTVAQRRRAILGFACVSFPVAELVHTSLGDLPAQQLRLQIYDGTPTADHLLYATDAPAGADPVRERFSRTLDVDGNRWTLVFEPLPQAFAAATSPHLVLGGGLVVSLLLAALTFIVARKERLEQEKVRRDQEFLSLFEQNTDAVLSLDLNGHVLRVNKAAADVVGLTPAEKIGEHILKHVAPQDKDKMAQIFEQARLGVSLAAEVAVLDVAGQPHMVDAKCIPIYTGRRITGVFVIARDITDRIQKEKQLEFLAQYDTLTGLPNRTLLLDRLGHAIARARREQRQVALMFLDLDKFKDINDSMGHAAGDLVLKTVAQRLKSTLREEDTVARLGGDEFTVLLEQVPDVAHALTAARKIIDVIHAPMLVDRDEIRISTSIGAAFHPQDAATAADLMKAADLAMYHAKASGRNTWQLFTPDMMARVTSEINLKNQLAHALERDELEVYYQPQIDARSGDVIGVEALLRWRHPTLGALSPAQFIPLAEDTGIIVPIGEWVFRTACRQWRDWRDQGLALRVAVNVSTRQFKDPQFAQRIRDILAETGADPGCIELEITESLLMDDIALSGRTLADLKGAGLKISIDDFGTGYSSLSYLANFPLDILKIDRSFVNNVATSRQDASIAEAIISLAHSLGLTIVAEGVETEAQIRFLTQRQTEALQGYYFSRPQPPEALAALLRAGRAGWPRWDEATGAAG